MQKKTWKRSSSSSNDKCELKQIEFFTLSLQINEWSMQTHAIVYRLNWTQVLMPFINSWKLPQTRYDFIFFFILKFQLLLPVIHDDQTAYSIFHCYWNIHKVEVFYHYEFCQGIDFMSYFINDCINLSIDASVIFLLKIQFLNVASHSFWIKNRFGNTNIHTL